MNVATLKTRLYALIQPILGGTVIWADQTGPRPAMPYSTMRLGVISTVGEPHYSDVNAGGVQTVIAVRESVLNVNRFGVDSVANVETFSDKMNLNSNLDKFSIQDISVFDMSAVTDIAQLLNGIAIEPRASVDLSLRWESDQLDTVGIIDTVISNGTAGPGNTALDEEYILSVTASSV